MTIMEIYKALQNQNKKMLNSELSFMEEYNLNSNKLDLLFANTYASREFFIEGDLNATIFLWEDLTNANIELNRYKYETLYNTTKFDYNPIENYNRKEEFTDIRTPDITTSIEETTTIGEQTNNGNTTYGSQTNSSTNVIGEKTDTTTNTIGDKTTTNKANTYDSSNLVDTNSTTETKGNDTSSVNFGIQTNTTNDTLGEKTDRSESTIGTRTDNGTNKTVVSGTETNNHTANISGNIGVMSTQDMIEQERKIALFSFYQVVFSDFINMYTIGVW